MAWWTMLHQLYTKFCDRCSSCPQPCRHSADPPRARPGRIGRLFLQPQPQLSCLIGNSPQVWRSLFPGLAPHLHCLRLWPSPTDSSLTAPTCLQADRCSPPQALPRERPLRSSRMGAVAQTDTVSSNLYSEPGGSCSWSLLSGGSLDIPVSYWLGGLWVEPRLPWGEPSIGTKDESEATPHHAPALCSYRARQPMLC